MLNVSFSTHRFAAPDLSVCLAFFDSALFCLVDFPLVEFIIYMFRTVAITNGFRTK